VFTGGVAAFVTNEVDLDEAGLFWGNYSRVG